MFLTCPYIDQAWLLKKCVTGMSFWLGSSLPSRFSSHLNLSGSFHSCWLAEEPH
jgi:hypothetical protein